jgi:uncharacterized protein (TIGR02594 family)
MNKALVRQIAMAELGETEIAGTARNNKRIQSYLSVVGLGNDPDETPWCSAFVNWVLKKAGVADITGSAAARSWLKFGRSVKTKPEPFDVVVFWRGEPNGWQGHVAFYISRSGDTIKVLGGNQGNAVSIASYPASRLLDIRRG